MIIFDLFCEDEHKFTPHSISEDNGIQTIRCLICENTREDVMFRKSGVNMNMKKEMWEEFSKDGK